MYKYLHTPEYDTQEHVPEYWSPVRVRKNSGRR